MQYFQQLVEEGQNVKVEPYPWMKDRKFTLVATVDQLKSVVDDAIQSGLCALDLETTGLDNRLDRNGRTMDQIVGYCLSYDGKEGFYVPVRHKQRKLNSAEFEPHPANLPYLDVELEIKRLCENTVTVYHNSPFDLEFLYGQKHRVDIDSPKQFEDTYILTYLKDSTAKRMGLKYACSEYLDMEMIELKQLFPSHVKNYDFSLLDPTKESTLWYAGSDGICTYELLKYYKTHNWKGERELNPNKTVYGEQTKIYLVEKALVPSLRWMDRTRTKIDHEYLRRLQDEAQALINDCLEDIKDGLVNGILSPKYDRGTFPYDPNSPKQLGEALLQMKASNPAFSKADLKLTESGQVQTDDEALGLLIKKYGDVFPFFRKIQTFRSLSKVLGTYIKPLYENADWDGNPHFRGKPIGDGTTKFEFKAWKTDTGRFAAAKGHPQAGGSGINVQSAPGCKVYAEVKCRVVRGRDYDIKPDVDAEIDPKIQRSIDVEGFLRRIYDGHFVVDWRNGDELCVRKSCDASCPFFESCDHSENVVKKMWSLDNAVRPAVVAREGYVFCAIDFAALELRAAAAIAKEQKWIDEFNKGGKNADLHTITAKIIYGDAIENLPASELKSKRGAAKSANFAIVYGGGGGAVAGATGVTSEEGTKIKNDILRELSGLGQWMKDTISYAKKHKEVQTSTGRKIRLKDIDSPEGWIRAKQERNAINSIVQGTATGDLIKYAMGSVYRTVKKREWWDICRLVLTVHDELVFEIREDKLDEVLPAVVECMTEYGKLMKWPIGLDTDIEFNRDWSPAYDWNAMHEIEEGKLYPKSPVAPYLLGKIKLHDGMWYLDGDEKRFFKDGEFVSEQEFLSSMTMTTTETEPERVPSEVLSGDTDTNQSQPVKEVREHQISEPEFDIDYDDDTGESKTKTPEKPKKVKSSDLPPWEYKMSYPITSTNSAISLIVRQDKVIASCLALQEAGFCKATNVLVVKTLQGETLVEASEGVEINAKAFQMLAFLEGI